MYCGKRLSSPHPSTAPQQESPWVPGGGVGPGPWQGAPFPPLPDVASWVGSRFPSEPRGGPACAVEPGAGTRWVSQSWLRWHPVVCRAGLPSRAPAGIAPAPEGLAVAPTDVSSSRVTSAEAAPSHHVPTRLFPFLTTFFKSCVPFTVVGPCTKLAGMLALRFLTTEL